MGAKALKPVYLYYCPMRPPTVGAVPRDGMEYAHEYDSRRNVPVIGRAAWGYAVYSRELTEKEVSDYELIPSPDNPLFSGERSDEE